MRRTLSYNMYWALSTEHFDDILPEQRSDDVTTRSFYVVTVVGSMTALTGIFALVVWLVR